MSAPSAAPRRPKRTGGLVDEDDVVDWHFDGDGDGFGGETPVIAGCAAPGDGWLAEAGDCDDAEAAINPLADEHCDGRDEDCDGTVDEGAIDSVVAWPDLDADGFGDAAASPIVACLAAGLASVGEDCDDTAADAFPGAPEVCDERDTDCDGMGDDEDPDTSGRSTWYTDADTDGDGVGAPIVGCTPPAGAATTATDCDDVDPLRSGLGVEVCDGLDNNCDGSVDEGVPTDGAGCLEAVAPTWDGPVGIVHVTARTGTTTYAPTDDVLEICLSASDCFSMNNRDWDDAESGAVDEYVIDGLSLDRGKLDRFTASTDPGDDQWRPECLAVSIDGEPWSCHDGLTVPIGSGEGETATWSDPLALGCYGCYGAPLTHGPIVGATGQDFTTIWYRTDATRRVALYIAEDAASLATAAPVHVSWPRPEAA